MYSAKCGWINICKGYGISSGQVVNRIKRILGCKVGHAGTLDPLATGVLPIALGEATKTISYITNDTKSYVVTAQWGIQRSTDDAEGDIVDVSAIRPTLHDIKEAVNGFIGKIQQVPPAFSAINVNGVRAYDISRRGGIAELKSREVSIQEIKITGFDSQKNVTSFSITCNKGVYIRSLIRDLGAILKCLGYVSRLHRKVDGVFCEDDSVTLERLEALYKEDKLDSIIKPMKFVMKGIPEVEVEEKAASVIKNGGRISIKEVSLNALYTEENYGMCYLVSSIGGLPIAICRVSDSALQPVRVFNY